jgi:ribosome biogenesis GTPase A
MASTFSPRLVFPQMDSVVKSYFIGHHRSALTQMKSRISTTDLIIECRDYRIPLISRNPLFETHLSGKPRVILYLSKDLARPQLTENVWKTPAKLRAKWERPEELIRENDHPSQVFFIDCASHTDRKRLLRYLAEFAEKRTSALAPAAAMIVGMPNVGKSTLLNGLRRKSGLGTAKVARTGALAGVTRKVGTAVKIVEGEDEGGSMYVLDTPGVFVPYVSEPEDMLKLALCGNIKESLISPTIMADYLLYRVNLVDPTLYQQWCEPTNDIIHLLTEIAKATGRKINHTEYNLEAAAVWIIKRWRDGNLGLFVLDEVTPEALQKRKEREMGGLSSLTIETRQAPKPLG